METNPIYLEYADPSRIQESFSLTLRIIEEILSERLEDYTKIWIQGSNAGRIKICFTLFTHEGYTLSFTEMRNFRNWKPGGNLENEIQNIESMINHIIPGLRRESRINSVIS